MILNDITQDNHKVLGDKKNKTIKFHRLDSSIEEAVSTFRILVEAEQRNGGPQTKKTWKIMKTLPEVQTRNRGRINQSIDVKELKAIP